MEALAAAGVSTAIFAPGWAHEHFSPTLTDTYPISEHVSTSMWEGTALPEALECNCDGKPHNTSAYQTQPILQSTFDFPAGSSTCFYTDFGSAFLARACENSQHSCIQPQVGLQSISPTWANFDPTSLLSVEDIYRESKWMDGMKTRSLNIKLGIPSASAFEATVPAEYHLLRLFDLAIDVDQRLHVKLAYSPSRSEHSLRFGEFGLYISFSTTAHLLRTEFVDMSATSDPHPILEYVIDAMSATCQIHEIGAYYKGPLPKEGIDLFCCHALSIIPQQALDLAAESQFQISNFRFLDSTTNGVRDQRLQWEWNGDSKDWPECLPWSKTTGPFSHFSVSQDGVRIGNSQSLAFPLRSEEVGKGTGESRFTVEAFCFAGVSLQERTIANLTTILH